MCVYVAAVVFCAAVPRACVGFGLLGWLCGGGVLGCWRCDVPHYSTTVVTVGTRVAVVVTPGFMVWVVDRSWGADGVYACACGRQCSSNLHSSPS